MNYLPPDPIEKQRKQNQQQEKQRIPYRILRRLRMVDPGLITTKLFFTSLLLTTILYTIPATILALNNIPLKYTFISANAYVFLQIPIFSRYTKKQVATGWLISLPFVLSTSILAYSLYQYRYLTIFVFIICMCMPVILPKFFPKRGTIIGVSVMNAYLNAMLNAPLLKEHTEYLYLAHFCSIITILVIALVSYIVVSSPLNKIVAVRKSLGAIAQGFSQLYVSEQLSTKDKAKKAKKLSAHFHNCAISIDAVFNAAPPLPEGLAQRYHRAVFDEDQAISTLSENIGKEISYFQERYYWNEFCKCRVIQNQIGAQIDDYIANNANKVKENNHFNNSSKSRFKNPSNNSLTNSSNMFNSFLEKQSNREFDIKDSFTVKNKNSSLYMLNRENSVLNDNAGDNQTNDLVRNSSTNVKNNHIVFEEENINKTKFEIDINYADLKATPTMVIADVTAKTNPFSKLSFDLRTRNFLQGLVAITLASIAGHFINDKYFYFASLGAYALLLGSSTTADKWRKMKKRILGTILGAILGIFTYWLVSDFSQTLYPIFNIGVGMDFSLIPIMGLLIIFISLAVSLIRIDYLYCVTFITATIVQTYNILHAPLYSLMFDRIVETTIGAVIGVIIGTIIFPVNSRKALNRGLSIFSVNLRQEINALRQIWVNGIYDENITQFARQAENINEGLIELSEIMVKTPWGKDSRNKMLLIVSTLNSLVNYMNNAVSHTMFIYELKGAVPNISKAQEDAIKLGLQVLDTGSQLLGLEYTQRNKHIWPDYESAAKNLDEIFENYSVLDSSITTSRTQPNDWHVQYFLARELSLAVNTMHILHSYLLKK